MIEYLALGDYYIAFKERYGKDWKKGEEEWKAMHNDMNWRYIQREGVFLWLEKHVTREECLRMRAFVEEREAHYTALYNSEKETLGFANVDLFDAVEQLARFAV